MEHHVVAAILLRPGEVLLCHRSPLRRWYPGVWDFPGGHIQPNEPPEAALHREVAEELGVTLDRVEGDPVLRRTDRRTGLDLTVWVSRHWSGCIANRAPEEHDTIGWFDARQLESLAFADPGYLGLLQRLLRA